jgi:glycerophosphoryl diester phosphodiesterase
MVELKSAWRYRRHDVSSRVAELLSRDDVVVSFERRALEAALRAKPGLRALQHVGYGVSIRRAATYAWAVGFHDPRFTMRGIRRAQALGLATSVYTVNDEARMRALVGYGVDGIFTDRPGVLRRVVDESRDTTR